MESICNCQKKEPKLSLKTLQLKIVEVEALYSKLCLSGLDLAQRLTAAEEKLEELVADLERTDSANYDVLTEEEEEDSPAEEQL